ncbi:hypothetical protein KVR01_000682 [Diaporthe batatas]|uniref:uncharacterized protein n=1 Tax=Diaporthe batatas TaxID=748121 RepID=UPI001D03CCDC|nr:uncharacterized protein KVR01_000682 [Diaporthe batatas]KAG8169937.1 hypothetical protein KVR01_000682 [Diaporthe batatas]
MSSYFLVGTDADVEKALEAYQPDSDSGPEIIQQTINDAWVGTFIYYFFTEHGDLDLRQSVIDFVCKHRPGANPRLGEPWNFGSYNFNIEIIFDDGIVLFRFPIPGVGVYPDDKIQTEVATMRYVADHTNIPVPHIYRWGTAAENPTRLHVPFIIMDYIPHATTIGQALEDPDFKIPSIPESEKRDYLYQQMADISLQLYKLSSDRIGSLEILDDGKYAVTSAPLPHNTAYQVVNCSVPVAVLPPRDEIYSSSKEYLADAADMHVAALLFMNEKFMGSADDCKNKFVARHLVRKILHERQQAQSGQPREVFRLWGDDFRPESVLLDKNGVVVGVVDWEFTYFAPETYYSNPPWWLLIEAMDKLIGQDSDSNADSDTHSEAHSDADRGIPDQGELSCDAVNVEEEDNRHGNFLKEWHELVRTYQCALEKAEEILQANDKSGLLGNHLCSRSSKDQALSTPIAQELPLSQLMKYRWDEDETEFALTTSIAQINLLDRYFWDTVDKRCWGKNAIGGYKGRLDLLNDPTKMLMDWFVVRRAKEIHAWDPKAILDRVLEQMDGKSSVLVVQDDPEQGH